MTLPDSQNDSGLLDYPLTHRAGPVRTDIWDIQGTHSRIIFLPREVTKINAAPKAISLSNQSAAFEVFEEHEKLTISEISARVNAKRDIPVSEQTVRRAVDQLVKSGFLKPHGKQNNAMLFGKPSASYTESQQLVNFNGELIDVDEFLRRIVDPEAKPLQRGKTAVISKGADQIIRKLLTFVIMSAGEPGYDKQLQEVAGQLRSALGQLEFAAGIIENFLNSPVWYPHYRDRIGRSLREVQEKDPELFQLANDFMKGG